MEYFFSQESWACLKIREESKVIGPAQPGRKKRYIKKDINLQALAKEYRSIGRRDYLQRIVNVLFKEY